MRQERELAEVKAEFLDSEGWMKKSPLPRDKVQSWLQSEDLEVLGAVHRLLHVKEHPYRVQPPLEFEEFFEFMTRYYQRCLCKFSDQWCDDWEEADLARKPLISSSNGLLSCTTISLCRENILKN